MAVLGELVAGLGPTQRGLQALRETVGFVLETKVPEEDQTLFLKTPTDSSLELVEEPDQEPGPEQGLVEMEDLMRSMLRLLAAPPMGRLAGVAEVPASITMGVRAVRAEEPAIILRRAMALELVAVGRGLGLPEEMATMPTSFSLGTRLAKWLPPERQSSRSRAIN